MQAPKKQAGRKIMERSMLRGTRRTSVREDKEDSSKDAENADELKHFREGYV
jgi:hypothetical protein